MEIRINAPKRDVTTQDSRLVVAPIKQSSVFITQKPLLTYIAEVLFWLGLSIGAGLLLGWMFKVSVPTLPKMINIPEPETKEAIADLTNCEDAVNRILKEQRIYFAVGSANISRKGLDVVDAIIGEIKPCEGAKLEIEGHTDNTGSSANNIILSKKRADAVAAVITKTIEEIGLEVFLIKTIGVGAGVPLVSNDTAEGRYQNRRIEMRLYE